MLTIPSDNKVFLLKFKTTLHNFEFADKFFVALKFRVLGYFVFLEKISPQNLCRPMNFRNFVRGFSREKRTRAPLLKKLTLRVNFFTKSAVCEVGVSPSSTSPRPPNECLTKIQDHAQRKQEGCLQCPHRNRKSQLSATCQTRGKGSRLREPSPNPEQPHGVRG